MFRREERCSSIRAQARLSKPRETTESTHPAAVEVIELLDEHFADDIWVGGDNYRRGAFVVTLRNDRANS